MASQLTVENVRSMRGMRQCSMFATSDEAHIRYTDIDFLWWPSVCSLLDVHRNKPVLMNALPNGQWRLQFMPDGFVGQHAQSSNLAAWVQQYHGQMTTKRISKPSPKRPRQPNRTVTTVEIVFPKGKALRLTDLLLLPERICSFRASQTQDQIHLRIVTRHVEQSVEREAGEPKNKRANILVLPKTAQFASRWDKPSA
jgi:hypothetical protein